MDGGRGLFFLGAVVFVALALVVLVMSTAQDEERMSE